MFIPGSAYAGFVDPVTVLPAIPTWAIKQLARLWVLYAQNGWAIYDGVSSYGCEFSDFKQSFDLPFPLTWVVEATEATPPMTEADYVTTTGAFVLPADPSYGGVLFFGSTLKEWMAAETWDNLPFWGPARFYDRMSSTWTNEGQFIRCYMSWAICSLYQVMIARTVCKEIQCWPFKHRTKIVH